MQSPQDTIAAIATPLGEGGLGVIRVSGTKAIPIVQSIFVSPKVKDLSKAATHTCHFGTIAVTLTRPAGTLSRRERAHCCRPSPFREKVARRAG